MRKLLPGMETAMATGEAKNSLVGEHLAELNKTSASYKVSATFFETTKKNKKIFDRVYLIKEFNFYNYPLTL